MSSTFLLPSSQSNEPTVLGFVASYQVACRAVAATVLFVLGMETDLSSPRHSNLSSSTDKSISLTLLLWYFNQLSSLQTERLHWVRVTLCLCSVHLVCQPQRESQGNSATKVGNDSQPRQHFLFASLPIIITSLQFQFGLETLSGL